MHPTIPVVRIRNSDNHVKGKLFRLDIFGGAGWHYRTFGWPQGFSFFLALGMRKPPANWPEPGKRIQLGVTVFAWKVPLSG